MKLIFDDYDWKARVAPAFIISLPIITTLTTCFDWPGPVLSKMLGGAFWFIIVYVLTVAVRNAGNSIESRLWENWSGPPSTIIMRWKDNQVGKELKVQYHNAVRNFLKLPMPSELDEATDPQGSDELITQALKRVRGVLREKDSKGLWSIDNANYGFQRNLLGGRGLWVILSIVGVVASGIFVIITKEKMIIGALAGNVGILACALYFGWHILPKSIMRVGFRYADSAWESFLNIASRRKGRA